MTLTGYSKVQISTVSNPVKKAIDFGDKKFVEWLSKYN